MRFYLLLGAIAALIVGYIGYWFFISHQAERALAGWIEDRRAAGYAVEEQGLAFGGFPFRIRVDATAPAFGLPSGGARWSAERLAVIMQPWKLHHALAELDGRHLLRLPEPGGTLRAVELEVDTGLASVLADRAGRWEQIRMTMERLGVRDPARDGAVTSRDAQLYARPGQREGALLDLVVKAGRTDFDGPGLPAPLRTPIDRIELDLTLNGTAPAPDLSPRRALEQWRDAGGTLDLNRAVLRQGKFRLEVSGTVTLDAALRPLGALTAKVAGHRALIDLFVAAGQLQADQAASAALALDLLAVTNGGTLQAPLTLQDGEIRLGPVVLGRLRPVLL